MIFWKSKKQLHFEDRPKGVKPTILLLHYTGMESAEEARARLTDPESKVSAHYLVYEDGKVEDLVPEDKRAWHAGVSHWERESDVNSHSIGVEIVNPGHDFGYPPFPEPQMKGVLSLCKKIMKRHNILWVLGHSDVAPERKKDPGELFDWKWLADNGVGFWPEPPPEDCEEARVLARNDYECEHLFHQFGYNNMAAYIDVVTAFQRHYFPERIFEGRGGEACEETMARLLSLIHQKQEAQGN